MVLNWLRRRRRNKILARPFPPTWESILRRNVPQSARLDDEGWERLRRRVQVFVAEKYWEGCNGLEITDEIRVTIAGQACRLVLGFEDECFDRLLSVLVYPGEYCVEEREHGPLGIVTEETVIRLGEAWHRGPVILSWPDVLAAGRLPNGGLNVVLHEFAHVLDMLNQEMDGTPPIDDPELYRTWHEVMTAEYEKLVRHATRGRATLLDQYGTKDEAEFFAVATECFFEQPVPLADRHPRLYNVLRSFYRQDPQAQAAVPRDQKRE